MIENRTQIQQIQVNVIKTIYNYNRYNVKSLPDSFLGTEQNRLKLLEMINELETTRNCPDEIDDVYKKVCEMYYKKMDTL